MFPQNFIFSCVRIMKIAFHMFNSFYATWYVQGVWKKTRGMKWILTRTCNANVILQYQIVWSNFLWLTHQPKSWKTRAFTAWFASEIFLRHACENVFGRIEIKRIQLSMRKMYLRIKFLELIEKIKKKKRFFNFLIGGCFWRALSIYF